MFPLGELFDPLAIFFLHLQYRDVEMSNQNDCNDPPPCLDLKLIFRLNFKLSIVALKLSI